jgi:hypothetical protein
MPANPEGIQKKAINRLQFNASPELSIGIRHFQKSLKLPKHPVVLYSRQLVNPDFLLDQDYLDIIRNLSSTRFKLLPTLARIDLADSNLELEFELHHEDPDIIAITSGLIPVDGEYHPKLYRRLDREKLVSATAINAAQTLLHYRLGDTLPSYGIRTKAPTEVYVSGVSLYYRHPSDPTDLSVHRNNRQQ